MSSAENKPNLKIGFIGAGRMAQALAKGFRDSGLVEACNMIASDVDAGILQFMKDSAGIKTTTDNMEVVSQSDVVILAVKPNIVSLALKSVASVIRPTHLFVSIAAGVSIHQMEKDLPSGTRLVRVMPNTPALVQCGASVVSPGSCSTPADSKLVESLFSSIGYCISLPEKHLDAVTAVSGSGPAYIFLAIEALADGGVKMGLPRDVAQKLAAQMVMGSAKMVLETGKHPGELKDAVCSPGGTTIAAVHELEKSGFRSALINAVEAAALQSVALGKKEDQK